FGPRLLAHTVCPGCSERLEFSLEADDLRVETDNAAPAGVVPEFSVRSGEYDVRFRPPCTSDLLAAERSADPAAARLVLIERCFLSAENGGHTVPPFELPAEVVEQVAERIAAADPQADVGVSVSCPACAREWRVPFDVVSFFWRELAAWGSR